MSALKTQITVQSPQDFLNSIEPPAKRQDAFALLELFQQVTGEKPVMWGAAIVGFGKYHYKSPKSAQEGDWFLVGFSPRKANLTLYILHGNEDAAELAKLGKHKASSGGCIYINKLADIDQSMLAKLIEKSFRAERMYSVK